MQITQIRKQERRDRFNLFVDGRFYAAISAELLSESGFRTGQEVSRRRLDEFVGRDTAAKAVAKALEYLARRPHAEQELRDKLKRKDYDPSVIDEAVARVRELGYLDDEAFARRWFEERAPGRGRRLLSVELRRKGVPDEIIERVLAGPAIGETAAAETLAARRVARLTTLPPDVLKRRLLGYLVRRGFTYDVARHAVRTTVGSER